MTERCSALRSLELALSCYLAARWIHNEFGDLVVRFPRWTKYTPKRLQRRLADNMAIMIRETFRDAKAVAR